MIDLTTREEDKDKFITKVYLTDEEDVFHIVYASGRDEKNELSLHNLNAALLTMEAQLREYREEYINTKIRENLKLQGKKVLEAFMAVAGVYMACNIEMNNILQIILVMLLGTLSVCYQAQQSNKIKLNKWGINTVLIAEEFLKNKEKFRISVVDPKTEREEDWYLLTLSEIEQIASVHELEMITEVITDEVKEEESARTTETLKGLYNRG